MDNSEHIAIVSDIIKRDVLEYYKGEWSEEAEQCYIKRVKDYETSLIIPDVYKHIY